MSNGLNDKQQKPESPANEKSRLVNERDGKLGYPFANVKDLGHTQWTHLLFPYITTRNPADLLKTWGLILRLMTQFKACRRSNRRAIGCDSKWCFDEKAIVQGPCILPLVGQSISTLGAKLFTNSSPLAPVSIVADQEAREAEKKKARR